MKRYTLEQHIEIVKIYKNGKLWKNYENSTEQFIKFVLLSIVPSR